MNEDYEEWRKIAPEFIFQYEDVHFKKNKLYISIRNGDKPFNVGDKFGDATILEIHAYGKELQTCYPNLTAVIVIDQLPTLTAFAEPPMDILDPSKPKKQSIAQNYNAARNFVQEWLDKQGHERCWYYPEIFRKLAALFGIERSKDCELPSRQEFEAGCKKYQVEQYGKKQGYYEDTRLCDHCGRDTPHECKDSTHERDSSGDYQKCLICKYWETGYCREQSEPMDEDKKIIFINTEARETISDYLDYQAVLNLMGDKGLDGLTIVYSDKTKDGILTHSSSAISVVEGMRITALMTNNA